MTQSFQRFTVIALVVALAAPMSAFAEKRSRQKTDMRQLKADLEAALAKGRRPSPAPSPAPSPVVSAPFAESLVASMNRQRAAYGLPPLRLNTRLSLAAKDRVDDMFSKHYFDHVAPDGLNPFTWVERRGYDYRVIGENLAVGYRSSGTVVEGWMRSPGHRANILGRSFDEVGIAFSDASPVRGYRGPLVVAMYGSQ